MVLTRLSSIIILLLFIASCKNCVECTCTDPENDVAEICFKEARDYYDSRKEWRDDIKNYEKLYDCECN